ncbi:hypothetical protein KQI52_13325 [bacterium]|nr:hypothetical protein [bacterium]
MIRLPDEPDICVFLDTNVWLAAIKNDLFADMIQLGEHPRISWLIPWEPDFGKYQQIMVRELANARDREGKLIADNVHINRILRQAGRDKQIFVNQPESDRFIELYKQFANHNPRPALRSTGQIFSSHQKQEGEIICMVCAERENALFCSQDDAARRFAETILPQGTVFSMNPLFELIQRNGIDLPGKLHAGKRLRIHE